MMIHDTFSSFVAKIYESYYERDFSTDICIGDDNLS